MKKIWITLFIITTLNVYCDDVDEIEYISKLYKGKYYKVYAIVLKNCFAQDYSKRCSGLESK